MSLAGLLVTIFALWGNGPNFPEHVPECRPEAVQIAGGWGHTELRVELADTPEGRARGLMQRANLPPSYGMLFIFDEPGRVAFWMKDTPLPLDMLFFDARGDLRQIHYGAVPHDVTPIIGGESTQFVLELAAGEVVRLGIGARSTLRHPAIASDHARWKC